MDIGGASGVISRIPNGLYCWRKWKRKLSSSFFALKETIFRFARGNMSQWRGQVISHHGGSFPFLLKETHLSLISVCLGKTLKASLGTWLLSLLFLGWKGKTSRSASILESTGNAPPLVSCLWSAHFLSAAYSRVKRHRNYIRQCKNACQWALSFGVLEHKCPKSFLHLHGIASKRDQSDPSTERSLPYPTLESKMKVPCKQHPFFFFTLLWYNMLIASAMYCSW